MALANATVALGLSLSTPRPNITHNALKSSVSISRGIWRHGNRSALLSVQLNRSRRRMTSVVRAEVDGTPSTSVIPVATSEEPPAEEEQAEADHAPAPALAEEMAAASESDFIRAPEDIKIPEPKRFQVASGQLGAIAAASVPLLLRAGTGVTVIGYQVQLPPRVEDGVYTVASALGRSFVEGSATLGGLKRPQQLIELYEFEGCPFCRKVREMVSYLDLDVVYFPCPANGPNFRPKAISLGGKKQFPYMVDPNTGVSMYESDDINKYLANEYGDGTVPLMLRLGVVTSLTAGFAMLPRLGKGSRYVPAKLPPQPLELWAYEPSPFCKLVREALCELELPHKYFSVARGSPKRQQLLDRVGHFQAPYLEDPNTDVKMFESSAIVEYLYRTYAISTDVAPTLP
eukprot:TRINITY_DN438_c0_g2_i6.p1 TRINITY_DN438_c0_g2~~TRINITY_DN438_c0_g2_i6.p1  ORF type:complete len:414 (+),score=105.45 TRINITY_DN438_c0_g2_i6:39-1244(+)